MQKYVFNCIAFNSELRYSAASAARHDLNFEVPYIKYIWPYVHYLVYMAMFRYVCRSKCCILSLLILSPDIRLRQRRAMICTWRCHTQNIFDHMYSILYILLCSSMYVEVCVVSYRYWFWVQIFGCAAQVEKMTCGVSPWTFNLLAYKLVWPAVSHLEHLTF